MNNRDKILISLTTGIAIGGILGILLAGEKSDTCKSKDRSKIIKGVLEGLHKKSPKPGSLKEEIEESVKEAFSENPEEYA
jgi:hypothetical protein